MKHSKYILINEFELPADTVLVFECSRPDEQPRVGIGPGKFDTGGAAIFFASIEQKGREIGEHVPDCESRDVLAIRFYTPESIDVLIRAAERAKANLLSEEKEAQS